MTAGSCRCGAEWSGLKPEHCVSCHHTFTGTTAGDRHRVGDHALSTGPDRRRCLTVGQMLVRGFVQNERGYWSWGGQKPSFWLSQEESPGLADYDWGPVPLRISQGLESEGDVA